MVFEDGDNTMAIREYEKAAKWPYALHHDKEANTYSVNAYGQMVYDSGVCDQYKQTWVSDDAVHYMPSIRICSAHVALFIYLHIPGLSAVALFTIVAVCTPVVQFTGIATQDFVRDSPWEKKKWEQLPKSAYAAYAWGFWRVHDLPGRCVINPDDGSIDPASCDWLQQERNSIQVRIVKGAASLALRPG